MKPPRQGCSVRTVRSVAVALLVVLLALTGASCGGDDEASSAEEWVDSFCTAALDWQNEIDSLVEEAGDDITALSADDIRQLGEDAEGATDEFIDEVRALGAPETESGEEIDRATDELTNTVESEKEEIRGAVEDVEDVTEFGSALATVTTSFGQMLAALGETIETIASDESDEELRTAFEDSEACDELREEQE